MEAPFTPMTIANFFIKRSEGVGHLKLQKLVYCVHGWWLALVGDDPMLINEKLQAWRMGPVFPTLYHRLKTYKGDQLITKLIVDHDESGEERLGKAEDIKKFLDSVWLRYEPYSGFALSHLTHKKDSPWDRIKNGDDGDDLFNQNIPNSYIKEEFDKINSMGNEKLVQAQ